MRENGAGETSPSARFILMHSRGPVDRDVARPAITTASGILCAAVAVLALAACTTVVEPPARPAPPEEETPLLNTLGSNWSDVIEAAQYFSRHRTTEPGEIAALIRALEVKGVREFVLREAAARALGLAGDPGAVPALIRRLDEDPDEDVRKAAAHALGALKATAAVPFLLARILDQTETHWVTAEAVEALGEIGDPTVIAPLEQFRAEHADFWMENMSLEATLAKLRAARTKVP